MSYPRRLKSAAMVFGPIGRLVRDRDRWRHRAEESGWNVRAAWAGLPGNPVPIGSFSELSRQPPIPMPPEKLRFMDVTEADFLWTADSLVQQLVDYAGLKPDHDILDVGCGYGRLAHALLRHGHRGRYAGFDIIEPHIAWCNTELVSASDGRYSFSILDVRNDRYNPEGHIEATDVTFDAGFDPDMIVLTSVFTHMYAEGVLHYLREIKRVLPVGGHAFVTFFLLNESQRWCDDDGRSRFPMKHRLNAFTRYMSDEDPLHAIAYDQNWIEQAITDAGLVVRDLRLGSWCGRARGTVAQDTLILAKL